jgi:GTP-binding protein EngB required for normal cell division
MSDPNNDVEEIIIKNIKYAIEDLY